MIKNRHIDNATEQRCQKLISMPSPLLFPKNTKAFGQRKVGIQNVPFDNYTKYI